MIVILSVFSWIAFKVMIESFGDVDHLGLESIPESMQVPFEDVRNFMIVVLSHFIDICFPLIAATLLLGKARLLAKVIIIEFLSSLIVVIFLNGRIYSIISSVL
ncbi:MAG TPA: hypothetical protein VKM55_27400 [Candidatus Lokiarchaeia archaeon]|nr:hypothetical protein [Candidatus Lokiarchaeia archaeon]